MIPNDIATGSEWAAIHETLIMHCPCNITCTISVPCTACCTDIDFFPEPNAFNLAVFIFKKTHSFQVKFCSTDCMTLIICVDLQ